MTFLDYLKDKIVSVFFYFIAVLLIIILLIAFDTNILLVIYIPFIILLVGLFCLIYNFFRKRKFYNELKANLDSLDQKYLILELLKEPSFLEGKVLCDILYDINKSMSENVADYKRMSVDFKEYIELWCHEIKTPIATAKLVIENNKNSVTTSINEEINKVDNLIEQVLYYARSENVEKDYIIKKINLKNTVDNIIKKNKKALLAKKIKVNISNVDISVNSDAKWLEFIINQIVSNSIKYSKDEDSFIKLSSTKNKDNVILSIEDNGIGIISDEIDHVFDACFTGTNGRDKYNSTGIGLYLCKKLCTRLEHNITIESKLNEGTIVSIIFPMSSMIEMKK